MSAQNSRCYEAASGNAAVLARQSRGNTVAMEGRPTQAAPVQNQPGTTRLSCSLLKAGIFAGSLGVALSAHALSLGELVIHSGLGQPFHGTVRYTTPRGDDLHPLCIRTRYV